MTRPAVRAVTFRSLHVRNYRLFFIGQLISVSGTWMQQIAQDWLVLHLSDSGIAVGVTTGLQFLPMLLFGMTGGVIADRFDKRRVLLMTQTAAGVLAAVMGLLVVTGVVELWMVFVLAFLLGTVTAIDNPTRQAFVVEMVGTNELTNAVGLNSAVFNSARVLGPCGGCAHHQVRRALACVLRELTLVRRRHHRACAHGPGCAPPGRARGDEEGRVKRGLQYVRATPELRSTIVLVAVVAMFGMNMMVVLPLLAKYTFHGGAGTYGLLTSVMALGALGGALAAAARTRPSAALRVGMAAGFGGFEVLTAVSPNVVIAAVALVGVGITSITFMSLSNTTLYSLIPHMRGRVMALYALVFLKHAARRSADGLDLAGVQLADRGRARRPHHGDRRAHRLDPPLRRCAGLLADGRAPRCRPRLSAPRQRPRPLRSARPWSAASSAGSSGATTGSRSRGGPSRPAAARRRAERAARRARRRRLRPARAASAPTSTRRTFDRAGRRRAALRATSTPPRCARRPGRACSPGATTTRAAWAASSTWPPASPATTRASRGRAAMLPAMLTPHGYAAYAVGKWHLTPEDEVHLGARRDRWPLGRGFERFYGFFPGETHQFVPALVHDNHLVEPPRTLRGRLPPHRGPGRPRHRVRRRTCATSTSTSRGFLYLATGACHSPHQAPRRVDRALPRPLRRRLGRVARARRLARQKATRRSCPRTPSCRRGPTGCRRGTRCSATSSAAVRPLHGGLRRATSRTPTTQLGRLVDCARRRRASSTTRSSSCCPTTARRPRAGRSARSTTCGSGTSLPRTVEEAVERIDEIGGPAHPQQLPVGLDGRRQHAVPPLEARDARGRRRRPADRPLAAPASPRAGEVRRQYVHAIDIAADACSRSSASSRRPSVDGVEQRPLDGVSFALHLRRRRRARARTPRSTTRCSAAGRSTTTGGRRSPTTRSRSTSPASTRSAWELYDLRGRPVRVPRPRRGRARSGSQDMVERWWAEAERNQVLPLDNRAVLGAGVRRARPGWRHGRATCTGRAGGVPEAVAVNVRNRSHASPPRSR